MSMIDDSLLAASSDDVAGASSLAALYTDPAVLAIERARLLTRSWALVASDEEVAAPGSYVASFVGGIPLAIVRGHDGVLRAFHNVCRHRGITLLEGAGTVGRFMTCPYHQWSYASTGELARVPQADDQFPSLELCDLGLVEAKVAVWAGMVFVNPWTESPPLAEEMGGLDRRLERFLAGPLRQVAVVQYEAACNWKLLVENHIDVYHLWYLHAKTLAAYDHRAFRWESLGDNWWSLEPPKAPSGGAPDWVPPDMRGTIGAYLLFPNLMLVTTDDYFASYDAIPVAPDRTRLTLRVRAPADADVDALVTSIRSFMAEDVAACERMQQGTASPWFGVAALATTHEEPIRRFHAALARRMGR
ncbi:MAG TPA: aromatic ring-hydroxylating dioxygenase subunit alpha [Acidimicrobiales bacterium]|jgi:phenylpropionate dioxygenase-like ring-hydroxylating dioxygenase large terminal subunit|nr:aromatic ring-hydroxylating dioxygenase subunit alpha [Acidimicrobiales bacterium]